MSVLADVKYTVDVWMELLEKQTLSIDYTPDSLDGISEKGHDIKYVTEEKNNHTMSYIEEQIGKWP